MRGADCVVTLISSWRVDVGWTSGKCRLFEFTVSLRLFPPVGQIRQQACQGVKAQTQINAYASRSCYGDFGWFQPLFTMKRPRRPGGSENMTSGCCIQTTMVGFRSNLYWNIAMFALVDGNLGHCDSEPNSGTLAPTASHIDAREWKVVNGNPNVTRSGLPAARWRHATPNRSPQPPVSTAH